MKKMLAFVAFLFSISNVKAADCPSPLDVHRVVGELDRTESIANNENSIGRKLRPPPENVQIHKLIATGQEISRVRKEEGRCLYFTPEDQDNSPSLTIKLR